MNFRSSVFCFNIKKCCFWLYSLALNYKPKSTYYTFTSNYYLIQGTAQVTVKMEKLVPRKKPKNLKFRDNEKFSFSNIYVCDLSYFFINEMDLLY